MYTFLLMTHSGWRYLALLVLAIAVVKYLMGWLGNGGWAKVDHQIGLITTILIDIQLLLGLVLWVVARNNHPLNTLQGMEHPVWMIIAIAAMHIGQARVKKAADGDKAKTAAITFIITGLLVALGVARITGVM
ncbi:MAG: hypothetical protein KJZ86_16555 [Caldilineaceae bacterium]|nr:hypothetical protein [Caldilineaceae bacterium]